MCSSAGGLLQFLGWLVMNDQAAVTASNNGWAALTIQYKRDLLTTYQSVMCNGVDPLIKNHVVGVGSVLNVLDDWILAFPANDFVQKFFTADTTSSIQLMASGALDFASVVYYPSPEQWATMPDVGIVPVVVQAIVPFYFVRNQGFSPSNCRQQFTKQQLTGFDGAGRRVCSYHRFGQR